MAHARTQVDLEATYRASSATRYLLLALAAAIALAAVGVCAGTLLRPSGDVVSAWQANPAPQGDARDDPSAVETSLEPAAAPAPEPAPPAAHASPFDGYPLIAHALGAWRGDGEPDVYTNSREALEQNYDLGLRVFEVDLCPTSDGALALVHDWATVGDPASPPTAQEWLASRIPTHNPEVTLTPMLFGDLLDEMLAHPDLAVVLDTKDFVSNPEVADWFLGLVHAEVEERAPALLERVVPYVYSATYYEQVGALQGFPQLAFTAYASDELAQGIVDFALGNDRIGMVCASADDLRFDAQTISRLEDGGIEYYAFTLDTLEAVLDARARGIHGFITDLLTPADV